MEVHWVYEPVVQRWRNWRPDGVLKLRKRLIRLCNQWLKNRVIRPPISPAFEQQWALSREAYHRRRNQPRPV